jgi:transcriptional regulator of NAD metabolism
MKSVERRKAIITLMMQQKEPLSGGFLSEKFGVSRQIIVHDIALLKSAGYGIISTHYGYLLQTSPHIEKVLKVCHTSEQTEEELSCIIENGGTVVDVFVWHQVYGKIAATLNIFSPLQVKQFMEGVRSGQSSELMSITGGHHFHTVRTENQETMDKVVKALADKNFLINEN